MKTNRLEIFNKVKNGSLTPEQGDQKLLSILGASVSEENDEDLYGLCAENIAFDSNRGGLSGTMYEEYGRECFRMFFKSLSKEYINKTEEGGFVNTTGVVEATIKLRIKNLREEGNWIFTLDGKSIGAHTQEVIVHGHSIQGIIDSINLEEILSIKIT